jgi:CheY-like chemotaxis protein
MNLPGKRALVVDDNESTRLLVEAALRRRGYWTDMARDGAEAIRILDRDDRYDLIVLDLMMPEIDGYGVVEYLREGKGFPPTLRKIIIITASPGLIEDDRLPTGMCEVLVKPFTGERLLSHASM